MDRTIYLDHAATTGVRPEALEEMLPYFSEKIGNPSSIYFLGQETKKAVELARERVAKALGAEPSEIFFTAGGSEADNLAIKGVAMANSNKGKHITHKIQHNFTLSNLSELKIKKE